MIFLKRLTSAVIAFIFAVNIFIPFSVSAASEEMFEFEANADGNSYTLRSVSGELLFRADIPESYNSKPVTRIAKFAFSDSDKICEITIPKTVTDIEEGAFFGCTQLSEIKSNSDRFVIVDGMLFTADKKTLVYVVDRSVTDLDIPLGTVTVMGFAAAELDMLTDADVPDSVKQLGDHCFAYCGSLEYISLPVSVKKIPEYAFSCCTALSGFTVSHTVTEIGEGAFNSCSRLRSILIPNNTLVSENAFFSCPELTVYCKNGSTAQKIADKCEVKTVNVNYDGSSPVTDVKIDISTQIIENGKTLPLNVKGTEQAQVKDLIVLSSNESVVAYSNGMLTARAVGSANVSVITVDGQFFDSVKITVTDPPSVLVSTHPYADNADEKKSYTVPGSPSKIKVTFSHDTYTEKDEDYISITDKNGENYGVFSGDRLAGKTLILNGDTINIHLRADDKVNAYGYRVVSAVSADDTAFAEKLDFDKKTIEINATEEFKTAVKVTPSNAYTGEIIYFSSSDSIASVDKNGVIYGGSAGTATISAVTEYGQKLAQCSVTVKDNAVGGIIYTYDAVGAVVSYCRPDAVSVTIPETVNGRSVYKIAKGAFSFNTKLQVLNISASITSIEEGTFSGNSALTSVSVAEANTVYASHGNCITSKDGKKLITVCGGVSSFIIPETVETVNRGAFSYIFGLTDITLGAKTRSITFGAVEFCHSLTAYKVSSGNSVFTTVDGVLYTDNGKTLYLYPSGVGMSFTVPNTVTKIAAGAFHSCKALENINIGSSVSSIAPEIICGSVSVKKITVDTGNKYFSSHDGALYNKAKTELLSVPPNTTGEYTVPEGVKIINRYAFYGCDIGKVNLPFTLETIELQAFLKNRSLSVVILPPLVKTIENGAFSGCEKPIIIGGGNIGNLSAGAFGDGVFYCPNGSVSFTAAEAAGVDVHNAIYISDAEKGLIAVNTQTYNDVDIGLRTSCARTHSVNSDSDRYSLEFTVDGEPFIPKQDFYVSLQTHATVGDEIKVFRNDVVIGQSVNKTVSFTASSGDYLITPAFAQKSGTAAMLKKLPKKTEYYKNDKFDLDGTEIYYLNEYGEIELITNGFEAVYSFTSYGISTVQLKYKTQTVSFDVKVVPKPLSGKVTLSGGVTVGTVINAKVSELSATDIPYTFTWYVNGVKVNGNSTDKYTITSNDIGKKVKVKVTASAGYSGSFESSEYLVAEDKITSSKYSFDKSTALSGKIPIKTTVKEFISNTDQKSNIKITKNGKALALDAYISTGAVVSLVYGDVTTVSYTAVVTGDINGDGNISITDFVNLKTTLLGTEQKDQFKKKASDINGDGKITITDFVQLKTHLLGGKQVQPR